MKIIYLASPYSHKSEAVREHRYLLTRHFTIKMLKLGKPIFSPIVYGKDMEKQIGTDYLSWKQLNDDMLRACAQFLVLRLPGWEDSKGVAYEIEMAKSLGLSITYVDPIPVA